MSRRKEEEVLPDGTVMQALTGKEKTFGMEYLTDFSAKNAAIRAGYSRKYAATQGYELLHRPAVSAYINQLQGERKLKLGIRADMVVEELASIAFAKIADFIAQHGEEDGFENAHDFPAAVSHRIIRVNEETGVRTITHFSVQSKIEALCALHRMGYLVKEEEDERGGKVLVITPRNERQM